MMPTQVDSEQANTGQLSSHRVDSVASAELDTYFKQALKHHEAEQWLEAERYYLKVLSVEAKQAAANYNLGMLKWQTNARELSLDFFQQALIADAGNPDYWVTYVDALIQIGQHAHARETLMRGIEHGLHGDEVDALVNQLTKPIVVNVVASEKMALSMVTKTPKADSSNLPQSPIAANYQPKPKDLIKIKTYASNSKIRQAFDLMQAGKLEQAKVKFSQLLKFYPTHPLVMSGLGSIAVQQNHLDQGIHWLEKSLSLDANQTTALSVLSVAYFQSKRFHDAVQCCDQAIFLNQHYAEAYINRGNALKALNQHEQALFDYEKANALKPMDADSYFYLADALNKLKQYERADGVLKQGLKINPNNVLMQTIHGEILLTLNRFHDALAVLNKAVSLDGQYFNAYLSRGLAFIGLRRFAEAQIDFQKAASLEVNPESAYLNLAVSLHKQGLMAEAMVENQKVLAINPKNIRALNNQGLFLADDMQLEQAFAAYDLAIEFDDNDALTYWNRAILQLLTGNFEHGWLSYEWRWKTILKDAVRQFSKPLWIGEIPLSGKTLLIYPEQGLGDYIQFCRYASMVEALGANVILEVPKPLKELLQSLPGQYTIIETGMPLPAFDYQCPIMSLPLAFKTNLTNIPSPNAYLFADEQKRKSWLTKLGQKTKPRIGLVWSGGTVHKNDHHRSIPLNAFQQLIHRGMEFHVLQKEIRENDASILSGIGSLHTYTNDLQDFTDTAALIAQMDLVISVDTSVAHLAAAMGKPCWILLPYAPDFRWLLERSDSPWYSSVTLFRQTKANNWPAVITQVKESLMRL